YVNSGELPSITPDHRQRPPSIGGPGRKPAMTEPPAGLDGRVAGENWPQRSQGFWSLEVAIATSTDRNLAGSRPLPDFRSVRGAYCGYVTHKAPRTAPLKFT